MSDPFQRTARPAAEPDDAERVAADLLLAMSHLQQWAAATLRIGRGDDDPSFRQFVVLFTIEGGVASPVGLARRLGISRAVVTGLLDRLEERGLVRREPDPTDRRRLRLVVTDAGREAIRRLGRGVAGRLATHLTTVGPADLAAVARAAQVVERAVAALRVEGPAAGPPADADDPWDDPSTARSRAAGPPGGATVRTRRRAPTRSDLRHVHEEATLETIAKPETEIAPDHAASPERDVTVIDVRDTNFREDAYATYERLRAEGPVSRVRIVMRDEDQPVSNPRRINQLDGPFHLVTRYEEGVAAILDPRFTVDPAKVATPEQQAETAAQAGEMDDLGRALSRNLLSLDPPDHARLRKLVQPSFTAGAMQALDGRVRKIADDLLDAAERAAAERGETAPDRAMDLVPAYAYPLPVTVISELVGIPEEDRAKARHWTENLLRIEGATPESEAEVRQRIGEFADYLRDLFERRRREPADDLVTRLVQAEEDGDQLSPDEVLAMVFVVYVAGFVTTVNLIGNTAVALLKHPDQLAAYKANPALAGNVIEETLRFWGPAESTLPRTALEDVELAGTPIRRGEQMRVSLASMDRDPARFERPEVYDIGRADANRHVAFGKGVHVCLGAPLARLEGRVALETLFGRYPDLRLAVPADEVRWGNDLLRGFRTIPLLF